MAIQLYTPGQTQGRRNEATERKMGTDGKRLECSSRRCCQRSLSKVCEGSRAIKNVRSTKEKWRKIGRCLEGGCRYRRNIGLDNGEKSVRFFIRRLDNWTTSQEIKKVLREETDRDE